MALTVITGPPAAGKSTWVLQRARPGDIVIDYDRLAVALTGQGADTHNHSGPLSAVTQAARQAAIQTALRHSSTVDVYIIHTDLSTARRTAYEAAGGRIVTIDPGRDTVRTQAHGTRSPRTYAAIDQWYRNHSDHDGVQPRPPRRRASSGASDPRGTQAWKRLRGQVFREETNCWRCGQYVDQTLPRTHPMSRTVDHLDPVASGGAGIPDRTRVRLAHRRCNSQRGQTTSRPTLVVTLSDI